MIGIIRILPLVFLFTVMLPIITGMTGVYMGWHSHQPRYDVSVNKQAIKENTQSINSTLEPATIQITVIEKHGNARSLHNQNNQALSAVTSEYKHKQKTTENSHRFISIKNKTEKSNLAEKILSTIFDKLLPIADAANPPSQPIITHLEPNVFKVVFSTPMRILPKLTFQSLPEGVTANVLELTKLGFTVKFSPLDIPISSFSFTASAE